MKKIGKIDLVFGSGIVTDELEVKTFTTGKGGDIPVDKYIRTLSDMKEYELSSEGDEGWKYIITEKLRTIYIIYDSEQTGYKIQLKCLTCPEESEGEEYITVTGDF